MACPDWAYTNRNRVERLWNRLNEWRAVASERGNQAATRGNQELGCLRYRDSVRISSNEHKIAG